MEKTISETIKQKTEDFIKELNNFSELNDYNISISIKPIEDDNITLTGEIDLNIIKSWGKTKAVTENFSTQKLTNGYKYSYIGKLAMTVK